MRPSVRRARLRPAAKARTALCALDAAHSAHADAACRAPAARASRTRSQQIIEPKAPLALRLAAILMRGVVTLYSRQIYFLHGASQRLALAPLALR
jgi:hypothetical protein